MAEKVYGIDLGSSAIKIAQKKAGIVLQEKNMISVANKEQVIAIGNESFAMYEKVPKSIEVRQPVSNGVIADFSALQAMMEILYKGVRGEKICDSLVAGGGASFYLSVPTEITDVEKRAFFELIATSSLKMKKIRLIEKPMAAALGAKVDFRAPGCLVVDVGAATTEITLISHGDIIQSNLLKLGGQRLDERIQYEVKKKHNLVIGMRTAERIKKSLARAVMSNEEERIEVLGRNLITGLPNKATISSFIVYDAIKEDLFFIAETIKMILDQTPPDMSRRILKDGICLVGGSANLKDFDLLVEKVTGYPVNVASKPEMAVARGLGKIIESSQLAKITASAYESLMR